MEEGGSRVVGWWKRAAIEADECPIGQPLSSTPECNVVKEGDLKYLRVINDEASTPHVGEGEDCFTLGKVQGLFLKYLTT